MDIPRLSSKEALILELLAKSSRMYGLEMVRASTDLKRGTIYVTLNRMEEKGYIVSTQEEQPTSSGPPRRMYSITGAGARALSVRRAASMAWEGEWIPTI